MKPIVVPRKFIEECCDVFLRHPKRNQTDFLLWQEEWRYLENLVDTLSLNLQEYRLDIADLAPLSRLYSEGVQLGWLEERELFDYKWLGDK